MNRYIFILCIVSLVSTFIVAYFEFGKQYFRYQNYNGPIRLPIQQSIQVKENQTTIPTNPSSNSTDNSCINENDDCFFVLEDNSKVYLLKTKTKNVVDQLGGDFMQLKNEAFLNNEPLFYGKELSIMYNKNDTINSILYSEYNYKWSIILAVFTILLLFIALIL